MPSIVDLKLRRRPKVAVAIPTTEYVPRKAFMAFGHLLSALTPGDHFLTTPKIATVDIARNLLIEQFLALPEDVEFLLLLDADMVVPTNLIDIWVGRSDYRFPFISGYCCRKEYPFLPTISRHTGAAELFGVRSQVYVPVTDIVPDSGLHRVDGVGAAALCVRRDVLAAIPPPWFSFEEGPGEDYYFCRKVAAVATPDAPDGVWIAVDSHVQIGHVGESIATPADWFAVKDTWLAETDRDEYILKECPHGSQEDAVPVPAEGEQESVAIPA